MVSSTVLLGLDHEGHGIREVKPAHSLILAAAGSGKTTCGVLPQFMSFVGDDSLGMVVLDSKNGELAAQCAPICEALGRKIAIIDENDVLKHDFPGRISLNPLNALIDTYKHNSESLLMKIEDVTNILIPEPAGNEKDEKNKYWRDSPRMILEVILRFLLSKQDGNILINQAWTHLINPELQKLSISTAGENEDNLSLSGKAARLMQLYNSSPDQWNQHILAAIDALRIFEYGSFLQNVGLNAKLDHRHLLKEKYVTFLVGDQRYIERMGTFYALHLTSFIDAQLGGNIGRTEFLLDEFTNAPLQKLINAMTIIRGFGGNFRFVAQSRSEIERKFGEKQAKTIDDNAAVKQWFGFTSIEEARRVSEGMGKIDVATTNISGKSNDPGMGWSHSVREKSRRSINDLLSLPINDQILYSRDEGWLQCRKISQFEIAPYVYDLGFNHVENKNPKQPNADDIKFILETPRHYNGNAPRKWQRR